MEFTNFLHIRIQLQQTCVSRPRTLADVQSTMRIAFIDNAVCSSSTNPCQETEFWHECRECDETITAIEGESEGKCYRLATVVI
jgi:hypothetical protein